MSDVFPPSQATPPDPFVAEGQSRDFGQGWTWVADAFSLFFKAPLPWIGTFVLVIIVSLAMSFVPLIGQMIINVLWPLILAGLMTVARNTDRGEPFRMEDLLAGFAGKTGPLFIVGLIYMLGGLLIIAIFAVIVIATVGMAMLGMILDPTQLATGLPLTTVLAILVAVLVALALAVPLLMAFWFAVPLVQFHGVDGVEAMKRSFFVCLKNIPPFLLYGVVTLVLVVVATIPFGLGLFLAGPVLMLTAYTSYRDVFLK